MFYKKKFELIEKDSIIDNPEDITDETISVKVTARVEGVTNTIHNSSHTKLEEGFEDSNNLNNDFYTFVWDEGGNDLKITGSFCNWKNQFQMTRDQNSNIFKMFT